METAGKQSSPFMELFGQLCLTVWATVSYGLGSLQYLTTSYSVMRLAFDSRLWKWLANSPPIYRTVVGTVLEQFSGKQSSPLMETAGKQFSPFMELFGQPCLTACASVSYCLCNCVLLPVQVCLTVCATVSYCLCKCVLLFGQLCLTPWATLSYCLGNCVLLLVEMVSKEFSHLWKRF
jgi:hypothetical protein